MNLYCENGYLDMKKIIEKKVPFTFIIGARGIGKTYGALSYYIKNVSRGTWAFMRRTAGEVEILSSPEYNPFQQLNNDNKWNYGVYPNPTTKGKTSAIYERIETEKGIEPYGEIIAPVFSLSTFAGARGFGGANINSIFYDEFIPENHVRKIRDEGAALMNMYESINRNRELKGDKPLSLVCASNSNRIDNDILVSFGLVNILMKNRKKGNEFYYNPDRGILVIDVQNSPISKRKQNTALYRATKDAINGYSDMALKNAFPEFSKSEYKHVQLEQLIPIVKVGEITIYRYKSKPKYHVSCHNSGNPDEYGISKIELERFATKYLAIRRAHLTDSITFDDASCEILLDKYFTI